MKNPTNELKAEGPVSDFPMRLNRFLALSGVASRREADSLIEKKKVSVNGKIAELGVKVNLGDVVSLGGAQKQLGELSYIAYFKPAGVFLDPASKAWKSSELGQLKPSVSPADLLEKDSEGLMILTNDMRVTRLLNGADLEREYMVKVQEPIAPTFLNKLESGFEVDGRMFKARKTEALGGSVFTIAFPGSRKDIQKVCEAMHRTVLFVRRERIANVSLKGLKPGARRELKGKELSSFLERLGL